MRHGIFAVIVAMLAVALAGPVAAAQNSQDSGGPAAFFPQTRYEFAPVLDGQKVVHAFVIQNKGTRPLRVQRVRTG